MFGGLLALTLVVLSIWFFWRILNRAGHSGWWALLLLIPLVNLVMIWVFAFARWPAVDSPGSADVAR